MDDKVSKIIFVIIAIIIAFTILGTGFTQVAINSEESMSSEGTLSGSPVTDSTGITEGSDLDQPAEAMPSVLIKFNDVTKNYVLMDVTKFGGGIADLIRVYDCNTTTTTSFDVTGTTTIIETYAMMGTHVYIVGFGGVGDWSTTYSGGFPYPSTQTNIEFVKETSIAAPSCTVEPAEGNLHNIFSITTQEGTPAVIDSNFGFFKMSVLIIILLSGVAIMIYMVKGLSGAK